MLSTNSFHNYASSVPAIDATEALQYFEYCLIKPPSFPGTLNSEDYLREISYEYAGRIRSFSEASEIVGEILGGELVKVVIALCIWAVTEENCSPKDARKLSKALEKVYANTNKVLKKWPYELDMERVAVGAAQNLRYLQSAGKPKVRLQSELNSGLEFSELRYKCVREYSPVRLRELLFERIEEFTGYIPVQQ